MTTLQRQGEHQFTSGIITVDKDTAQGVAPYGDVRLKSSRQERVDARHREVLAL